MTNPTKYVPGYSYAVYQATSPASSLPAPQFDNDLANISSSIGQTIDALADIRRSDGKLNNGIVTSDSLAPSAIAALGPNGALILDAVADAQAAFGGAAASATASDTSATGSAASATASAASATAAAASATAAATSATAAATSATASATSATAAATSAANAQSSAYTLATWTALAAITGTTAGQGAEVLDADAGTHTDPVVGGTVSNAGRFTWSASPAGWKRIGATGLSAKADTTYVQAELANVQGNALTDSVFGNAVLGALTINTGAGPNSPQPGLPYWYFTKAGAYNFPTIATVVADQWNAITRTVRAIRMRMVRTTTGTVSTDIQLNQYLSIPAEFRGRTDIPITLIYHYYRASADVTLNAVFGMYNSAGTFISNFTVTKVSTDVTGSWATAVFTGTITNASAAFVVLAPRMLVLTVADGGATPNVDEDAWLGPVFAGFWRTNQRAYDVNANEQIDKRVLATYPGKLSMPWMAGRNAVVNGTIEDSTVAQTTAPTGYVATSGGSGTVAGSFSVVADTGLNGITRALEVAHSNNGTVRTDRQFQQIIDIPPEFWGDTTLKVRLVQHVKRTSLLIDALAVVQMLDASGTLLSALTVTDLSPIKGDVNQWVALAWEATVTNVLARKLDIRFRTQVNTASGVVSGISTRQTGFFVGWNRGADAITYDRNLSYDVGKLMKANTDADKWVDTWGNAHRTTPAARLGVWGDSQTDALEEYLITAMPTLTGAGYGIGGETSGQILARAQGYQANVAGLTWSAGTKRLRGARVIPPRLIDETYRAQWVSYGAKIAEPNYVEFFNRYGRLAQVTDRLQATATVSGDTWTASGHPFVNGDVVHYRQASGPSNSYRYKPYYVSNVTSTTFKLNEYSIGPVITFAAFGGTVQWLGDWYYDWAYDGVDNNTITVKTHCPTDEEVVHICVGTNDFGASASLASVTANIMAEVAQLKTSRSRFIISGIPGFWSAGGEWATGGAFYTKMMALKAWLLATYPDNFLDIYAYLLTQGDGGTNDNADIAAGYVPRSLRASSTDGHLNGTGQTKWAAQIAALMTAKAWL